MRTLAIFLIFCVALAVAYPKWGRSDDDDEGNYGRTRLVSTRRSSSGPGPYYFLRSPRYGVENENQLVRSRGQAYRVFRADKRQRDSDEDSDEEEEDDAEDDDTTAEAEDDEFSTPAWDYLFPNKQQNTNGQSSGGPSVPSVSSGPSYQGGDSPQSDQGYSLQAGSPGGPEYSSQQQQGGFRRGHFGGPPSVRGRSSYDRNVRPVTVRVVRPSRQYQSAPMRRHGQQNYVSHSQPRFQSRPVYGGNRMPYAYVQSVPSSASRRSYKPVSQQYVYTPVRRSYRRPNNNVSPWGKQRVVSRPVAYRPAFRSIEEYDD